MACCLRSRKDSQAPYIVDVEKIIRDYVWDAFKSSRPAWQQLCLRRKDFVIDVPMNYFHFDKIEQEIRRRQKPEQPPVQPQPSLAAHMKHMDQQAARSHMYSNSNVMALNTDFTNCTANPQTYKFRFEKTRKASLNVTFQRGFTVGGKVNLNIGLPKVTSDSRVSGDIDMRLTVNKSTGELIEETLTWEATSEIQVSANSNYTAKVVLSETPVSYNFMVLTRMSLPVSAAPCTVRRKNNESFSWTKVIEDLKDVFETYEQQRVVKINENVVKRNEVYAKFYTIDFKTTGIIEGVRLSDQKILLEGTDLGAARAPQTGGNPAAASRPGDSAAFTEENRYRDGSVTITASTIGRLSGAPQSITIPIIEEMPEDDGGVTGLERREDEVGHPPSHLTHARTSPSGAEAMNTIRLHFAVL
nr:hypothetical protein BaRGS_007204 [Batillaria attramentaria]